MGYKRRHRPKQTSTRGQVNAVKNPGVGGGYLAKGFCRAYWWDEARRASTRQALKRDLRQRMNDDD